jgi:hypothetical protein
MDDRSQLIRHCLEATNPFAFSQSLSDSLRMYGYHSASIGLMPRNDAKCMTGGCLVGTGSFRKTVGDRCMFPDSESQEFSEMRGSS